MVDDEQKAKALSQYRLQLNGVLAVFNLYGMGAHVPEVISQLEALSLQLHERLSGKDVPLVVSSNLRERYG